MGILSILDREHTVAPPGYSRWLIPPAALAVHLCIGQAYATSVYKTSMGRHFDTGQTAIGVVFRIAIVMLGLSAAIGGTWVERNGPRKAMFVSACFWATGFLIGALGIGTGQLWIVYLGYGVIGGIGLGNSASVAGGGALVALFLTLGIGYFVLMMFGVFTIRVPAEGWKSDGFDPSASWRSASWPTC